MKLSGTNAEFSGETTGYTALINRNMGNLVLSNIVNSET